MAGELLAFGVTATTVYGQAISLSTGQFWNTSGAALETYATANIANYALTVTEEGTASGMFKGNMPAVPAGSFQLVYRTRAGGSPAEADIITSVQQVEWDGSAVVTLTSRASPTNITGGTITTVTNLTNAPTAGDFTATMKANFPTNFASLGISAAGKINEVVLVDTLTTYASNTPQSGDAYARLGAPAGASVSADVAAIKAKTDNLPASPAATGDAMTLTVGERSSVADALLDRVDAIEVGLTLRQFCRIADAALAGKLSGAGTGTETFRNAVADSKNRIVATVDAAGDRTALAYDLT